jgi:hypothetical protein
MTTTTGDTMTTLGDCFRAAAHFAMYNCADDAEVVHGTVRGTGGLAKGKRYTHAWVELNGHVLEVANGRHLMVGRDAYYRSGRVQDVRRYSIEEATLEMLRTGHYGPWDPAFDLWP